MTWPPRSTPRGLGLVTAVVLVAGAATAVSALPLFLGVGAAPLVGLHIAAASVFFAILALKLVLLGARARLRRGRRSWRLLIAQGGSLLAAYTLLTGILVSLDRAWSDQHLAASFWLMVVVTAHARQYRTRLRAALLSGRGARLAPDPAPTTAALPRSAPKTGERVVVVGGGMAGQALVEELVRRGRSRVTLIAEEEVEPYDRTRLSELLREPGRPERLARRPREWYAASGIDLRLRAPATTLDLSRRRVIDRTGAEHEYEALVLATGSRAFVPPIPGTELAHVFTHRTRRDAEAIARRASGARTAVVVGGGLLGLEAAGALCQLGLAVSVVEMSDHLMPQQLDPGGAAVLARSLARLGVESHVAASVACVRPSFVGLCDGRELPADLVVVAAGVRPETALAVDAGLLVRRGVIVDDQMRTSGSGVWAVGECAEHRGLVHGLWPPLLGQVRAAAESLAGTPQPFEAPRAQAVLKVAGIDLFVTGRTVAGPGDHEILRSDSRSGAYAKLVLADDRLAGAVVLGDTSPVADIRGLAASQAPVPRGLLDPARGRPREPADGELVCHCMHVTRGEIRRVVQEEGAGSKSVAALTGATTGCGSCAGAVARIAAESRDVAAVE